jgi:hypothetical protein
MVNLMTPESVALLIAAIAFAVRMLIQSFNSYVETRNSIQTIKAQNETLKAEAQARDIDAENEYQQKVVSIMETLTFQNGQWPPIAADFATAQMLNAQALEKINLSNEKLAIGFEHMATENRSMRLTMDSWSKAIDGSNEGLAKEVSEMKNALAVSNHDHQEIKRILKDDVVRGIEKIVILIDRSPTPPDDTEPDDVPPTPNSKTTHADAGAKPTLDFPDDHNQEPLAS